MNQCPPGPQVFHWSHFDFFRKFAEIFANYCLLSLTPVINCSAVSKTPAKNLSPVSTTPAISPFHRFSVIAGVVDTGDKFIVDTGDQLSAVTTKLAINLSPVTRSHGGGELPKIGES